MTPEAFRINTNHFLQTARTITFLIQKNKKEIPDFDNWYNNNILQPSSNDEIMKWAKTSRNKIEKEGDLELNSSLSVSLIYSYLPNDDIIIKTTNSELLCSNIKQLINIAKRHLPTGISDQAFVKIQRQWITSSLNKYELFHALTCVYSRTYSYCLILSKHLNLHLSDKIQPPDHFNDLLDTCRKTQYHRIDGTSSRKPFYEKFYFDKNTSLPQELLDDKTSIDIPHNFANTFEYYKSFAKKNFLFFGKHINILILFDDTYNPIQMIAPHFSDQTDKYIFWRLIAEKSITLKVHGAIWIAEAWIRKGDYINNPTHHLPIIGETLNIIAFDKSGNLKNHSWKIIQGPNQPIDAKLIDNNITVINYNIFIPMMKAIGMI